MHHLKRKHIGQLAGLHQTDHDLKTTANHTDGQRNAEAFHATAESVYSTEHDHDQAGSGAVDRQVRAAHQRAKYSANNSGDYPGNCRRARRKGNSQRQGKRDQENDES